MRVLNSDWMSPGGHSRCWKRNLNVSMSAVSSRNADCRAFAVKQSLFASSTSLTIPRFWDPNRGGGGWGMPGGPGGGSGGPEGPRGLDLAMTVSRTPSVGNTYCSFARSKIALKDSPIVCFAATTKKCVENLKSGNFSRTDPELVCRIPPPHIRKYSS
jgi:hypothetical protein